MDNKKFTGVNSLKGAIQLLAPAQISLISGEVTGLAPLTVQGANDPALRISGAALICPARVLRELKSGDSVYILMLNGGRQYYILDKR